MTNRDRPSHHGAALGRALAAMADAGDGPDLPRRCQGCAFREGSYANASAGTVAAALSCITGEDDFACHHGLIDGKPSRRCAGYLAALRSTMTEKQAALEAAANSVSPYGPDIVREEVDAWLAEVDPDDRLDDYERARLWQRRAV